MTCSHGTRVANPSVCLNDRDAIFKMKATPSSNVVRNCKNNNPQMGTKITHADLRHLTVKLICRLLQIETILRFPVSYFPFGVIKSHKINILLLWHPNGFQILEYTRRRKPSATVLCLRNVLCRSPWCRKGKCNCCRAQLKKKLITTEACGLSMRPC
jgi:hypothetical protein